ncbi:MAG: hypothetical protein GY791_10840 [Alphaproteobacteria bacterium]|nr:hypothetical protein [Alphaproteobacteria bacterium]
MKTNQPAKARHDVSDAERRAFLHKAAKVGVVTPAAVTMMLAAGSRQSKAALLKYVCEDLVVNCEPCSTCTPCDAICKDY